MKKCIYVFLMGGVILFSGCMAQDNYRLLENRITAIEMETYSQREQFSKNTAQEGAESLNQKHEESVKTARENTAEIKYEIQQIQEKFRHMEGRMEEMAHDLGTNRQARQEDLESRLERLDNAISRNYEKIMALEKHMGFEPGAMDPEPGDVPPPEKSEPSEPLIKPEKSQDSSEQEMYDLAKKALDEGERENARIQFENFIKKYPNSQNADNARFWIAESYYAEKWYEKAILEYQKVLEKYPDSNKIAAARLKQGYSFAELGEKANARLILKELIKRHPDSNEAKYAQEKLKSLN